ncbi:MAG: phosphoribosylanthranilate isomerase [Steroidobacteraceae bacterium]
MTAPLWIKVCGLRTTQAIEAAATAGADAVGFVFHAGSPRHVDFDAARELAAAVPAGVATVAVFLHPSQALVNAALDALHPDWVQTDAADLDTLRLPAGQRVLPVFRTGGDVETRVGGRPGQQRRFLLESARSGQAERADWATAARLTRRGEMVLAGGLDADNVAEAIAAARPFGVDVSSGVESSRGIKDAGRIRAFVEAARAAARD